MKNSEIALKAAVWMYNNMSDDDINMKYYVTDEEMNPTFVKIEDLNHICKTPACFAGHMPFLAHKFPDDFPELAVDVANDFHSRERTLDYSSYIIRVFGDKDKDKDKINFLFGAKWPDSLIRNLQRAHIIHYNLYNRNDLVDVDDIISLKKIEEIYCD